MTNARCEKAHFPFAAQHPYWSAKCLSVARDDVVRVVRREPAPSLWCIAENNEGSIGLLPTLALRAGDPGDDSLNAGVLRSGGLSGRRRHFDPSAVLPIQKEDECLVLASDGGLGRITAEEDLLATVSSLSRSAASSRESSVHHRSSDESDSEDDVELFNEVVNRSRASRERSAKKSSATAVGRNSLSKNPSVAAWSYPAFCKDDKEAHDLYTQLLDIHAETKWLECVGEKVVRDTAKASQQAAEVEAMWGERRAAVRADMVSAQQEIGALREVFDAAKKLGAEQSAPGIEPVARAVLTERDPNNVLDCQQTGKTADCSTDEFVDELIRRERETLTSYRHQAEILTKRRDKVAGLLAALDEESRSLERSEQALADVAAFAELGDVVTDSDQQWPRTLEGLTDEESTALANYVRLYDKYVEKRHVVASEAPQELANHQKAKAQRQISRGDAEVEKMTRELQQLRAFVEKYKPKAAKVAEQLALGREILAKKQAYLATLDPTVL